MLYVADNLLELTHVNVVVKKRKRMDIIIMGMMLHMH
jgi:hypothetical protein